MPSLTLLPVLAVFAVIAMAAAAVLLILGTGTPQFAAHLAFAVAVMPLILAAMGYFVPVLTRSAAKSAATAGFPLLAWAGGAIAAGVFASSHSHLALGFAASLGAGAAAGMGAWAIRRSRHALGPRHPGLDWYLAALGFLVLALLAVMLMPLLPAQRNALRLFHLHANLLGFIGLTALGTLQVLLPTCIGQHDPDAGRRLKRDFWPAVAGVLIVAMGAFLASPVLALPGAALIGWTVVRMLSAWRRRFGAALLQRHGAAPSLAAAALGLLGLLVLGALHALGWIPARPQVAGFVLAFLLPLVTGAAAHLLPVWLRPGAQGEWHRRLREKLCRWGGVRGWALAVLGWLLSCIA